MFKKLVLLVVLGVIFFLTSGCVNRIRQVYVGPERKIEELALISIFSEQCPLSNVSSEWGYYTRRYYVRVIKIDDIKIPGIHSDTYATVIPGKHTVKMKLFWPDTWMHDHLLGHGKEYEITRYFTAGETYDWIVGEVQQSENHYLWLGRWPMESKYPPETEVFSFTLSTATTKNWLFSEDKDIWRIKKAILSPDKINGLRIFVLRPSAIYLPKHLR